MRQWLKLHPDSRSRAVAGIEVRLARPRGGILELSYFVTGTLHEVRLPPVGAAARGDALWRHTCFEAFIGAAPGATYYEFNFAPSRQWAVYRFSGYRRGMDVAAEAGAPEIEIQPGPDSYSLQATLDLDGLSDLPRDAEWRLGLSALIEDMNGAWSYWALAHPPGKPDFHHADCFAHTLAPAVLS